MTVSPDRDRPWVIALAAAVGMGLLASVAGLVASVVGISTVSDTSGITSAILATAGVRTMLTLGIIAVAVMGACTLAGRGEQRWWALTAGLGVVFDIWAWTGNALLTATLLSGGAAEQSIVVQILGFVVDLVLWIVIAWVAAGVGLRLGEKRRSGAQRLR